MVYGISFQFMSLQSILVQSVQNYQNSSFSFSSDRHLLALVFLFRKMLRLFSIQFSGCHQYGWPAGHGRTSQGLTIPLPPSLTVQQESECRIKFSIFFINWSWALWMWDLDKPKKVAITKSPATAQHHTFVGGLQVLCWPKALRVVNLPDDWIADGLLPHVSIINFEWPVSHSRHGLDIDWLIDWLILLEAQQAKNAYLQGIPDTNIEGD